MSSIVSTDSGLPSYRASTRRPSSPTDTKRESIFAIISSYRLPPSPRSTIAPFGNPSSSTSSLGNSQPSPSKSRRAPPPPALRLFPRDSTPGTAKAVHYPPSPWIMKDDTPVKWEWTAPVGGEEEGVIVGDEGKGKENVFSTIEEMERGAVETKGVKAGHREWNPVMDGPRMSIKDVIGLAQMFAILACIVMLLLVLLSPVSTMKTAGLLVLSLADGRVLTLGALGACYTNGTSRNCHCTGTSVTPSFASVYTTVSLPSSTASHLPLSFPLFPTAILLCILLLAAAMVLLAALNFPRRKSAGSNPLRRKLLLVAAGSTSIAFVLGLAATISQWSSLNEIADGVDFGSDELTEVKVGSTFKLLWAVWTLIGLTLVGWGVQGREKEQERGSEKRKSFM